MKKIIFLIVLWAVFLRAGWDGKTIKEPPIKSINGLNFYDISSPEELAWFAQEVNEKSYYKHPNAILSTNIDLNENEWIPIGKDTSCSYRGIFDGNYFTVSNFFVGKKTGYAGFFGIIDSGTVKNITIENDTIQCNLSGWGINPDYRYCYIGGIAGFVKSTSTIENANAYSILITNGDSWIYDGIIYAGGVAGFNEGRILNSRNEAELSISCTNSFLQNKPENLHSDSCFIGGLVGYSNGKIINSLNKGNITVKSNSTTYVGGISGFSKDSLNFCGNYGHISVSASDTNISYTGGITGFTSSNILNVFNQGNIKASHFAAGIASFSTNEATLYNFYIAADSLNAPNTAAFVHHNEGGLVQNGFLDGDLLKEIPLISENEGVTKSLFVSNTQIMQSDSFAFALDMNNFSNENKYWLFYRKNTNHWSRENDYPIFSDSTHAPIYKITFITHKSNSCTDKYICELNSTNKFTNFNGNIDNFPLLQENAYWVLFDIRREYKMFPIQHNHTFDWKDSLVVASYKNCNEFASTNTSCCINYMLDFEKEYASIMNPYYMGRYPSYHYSPDTTDSQYCLDKNQNELLDWNDSSSNWHTSFLSRKAELDEIKQNLYSSSEVGNTSSSTESISSSSLNNEKSSSSSKRISSSSTKTELIPIISPAQFAIHIHTHTLQISTAPIGSIYAIFDMQGRILKKGLVESENFNIAMSQAGSYIIRVGNQTQRISVK